MSKFQLLISMISIIFLGVSCRESATQTQPTQAELLSAKVIVFGEVKDKDGQGIMGVSIRIGDTVVQSNADGYFQLESIEGDQILRLTKSGYLSQRHRFSVQKGIQKSLDLVLWPQAEAQLLDSDMGGEIQGENGASVQAPPLAFVNRAGDLVSGMVEIYLTPLDSSNPLTLTALGNRLIATQNNGESTLLQSYGMLEVTVMQGEEELNVAEGKMLNIQIPAPAMADTLPMQTGLWSLDEENHIWIEEGTAVFNPQNNTYEAQIPHLSAWNADDPTLASCVCGLVVDEESAQVLAGAQITAMGKSYDGVTDGSTDENGKFCINVRVSSTVEITAQHDLGGGLTKTIMSSAVVSSVPPNPAVDQCTDIGEFRVKKRVIIIEDPTGQQTTTACGNDNPFSQLGECFSGFEGFHQCYVPTGACTYLIGTDQQTTIKYENGAKTIVTQDGAYEYYNAQNQLCYRTTYIQDDAGQSIQYRYEDQNGNSILMTYSFTGDMSWACSNGTQVMISAQENQEFQICAPAVPDPQVGPQGDCDIVYSQCEKNADCESDTPLCCVAQTENLTYRTCVVDQMGCDAFKAQITGASQ